jgi:uncharacterized integral membrane protein (TIGR00698 family)
MTTLSSELVSELGAHEPQHEPKIDAPVVSASPSALSVWPGLVLTATIAATAFGLRQIPYVSVLSPIILSITIGMVFHNVVGTPALARPGVTFSMRRLLRFAIVLLGLQLTASQLVEVGASGLAIIAATLTATFLFTVQLGRLIGVDRQLSELIAAGTSICGASAVIATNTVTRAPDEDVAYAVACVTVFGSIAMFVYPLLPGLLHLDPHAFGLWSGASIHEIAQVVAAAFQDGRDAGEFGTIAKLARVTMLAPVVMSLGFMAARQARRNGNDQSTARAPLPWFVLGFIALVGLNSLVTIPAEMRSVIVTLTTFLLAMALAAMGLETDIRKLYAKGLRPLLLGAGAFLFISSFSFVLIKTFM